MARRATWKADVLDERQIQKLIQIYSDEERRLSDLILRAIAAGRPTDTYTSFRHQISKELDRLRRIGVPAAQGIVRDSYDLGKREADRLLKEMGTHTSASFAFPHVHREAVNLLVQSVTTRLEDLNQVIGRRVLDIYREISLESLRSQIIGTEAWRAASERFRDDLASRGITGFVDKRGRQWNMTTYVQMVARTTPMEAHLQGTCNRLLESGIDLVKVSDHVDPCEKCAPWEGKVLSISGQTQGYPTVAEARAQGLFHPNCRHATSGYLKPYLEEAGTEQRKPVIPVNPAGVVLDWDAIFLNTAGPDGVKVIKSAYKNAPDRVLKALELHGGEVKWTSHDAGYYYNRMARFINLQKYRRKAWSGEAKNATTVAHEMGHFFDHLAQMLLDSGVNNRVWFSTSNSPLQAAIMAARQSVDHNTLRSMKTVYYPDSNEWKPDKGFSEVSDIIDAVTEGGYLWGFGHGDVYWQRRRGHGEAAEITANIFSMLARDDKKALDTVKALFPDLYKAAVDCVEEILRILGH